MNERNAINKLFDQLFMERVHHVALKTMQEDMEYKRAFNKVMGVFELLRESLSEADQLVLFEKLEESQNELIAVQMEYAYIQGIKDSEQIQEQLKKCGLSFEKGASLLS
ncbi:hypothetical protein KD909_15145 (plasmid) [Exiguobacterium sp. PFWT01]|uniref:DUF6809 family protein n=1 Tax=Exiguobacterium sp. PFWT01 TaxID=2829816 RepID=UPI001BA964DC|nr:DUF6809 family protein [Exiguobacterium sp. PFWT01]QUP88696.1 hypothetical protein KD909_15145 [Exiguobacterium sp. PFWT01]